jgi:hypothetical protein
MKISDCKWLVIICLGTILYFSSCGDSDEETVTISSITPEKGFVGTTVTINGSNFSSVLSENDVKFNNTSAVVTSASATQLVTTVPAGASTGRIKVTVAGSAATSPQIFTVLSTPTLTTFSPLYALPGALITISGTNFNTVPADNTVTINNVPATVTTATPLSLVVVVPDNATTGKISVVVNGVTLTTAEDFEVLKDIPRTGLVAFYPLDGNANDVSENALTGSLHGTTNGGPTTVANRFGTSGKSLLFDGVDDYASMGNTWKLQIKNTITVAGWFNIHAYKTADNKMQTIVTNIYFDPNHGGNPTRGFQVSQDFTGGAVPTLYAGCYSSAGLPLTNYVGSTIGTGSWIFFALIIDGKTYKFYQNGVLTNEATVTHPVNILDEASIGDLKLATYNGGFFFDGSIDDLAIYNTALSTAEITQLYEQTVSKY